MAAALNRMIPRLLCRLGLHRWRDTRLLEQTLSSGIKIKLDGDACTRCAEVRDLNNFMSVYGIMAATGGGPIVAYPAKEITDPDARPCATCNDDPAVCATIPGLRHCEAAQRHDGSGLQI